MTNSHDAIQPDDWVYGPTGELLYVVDVREWSSDDGAVTLASAQCFGCFNGDRAEWYDLGKLKLIEPEPDTFACWAEAETARS